MWLWISHVNAVTAGTESFQTFSEINGDCPRHEEGHIKQRIDRWMSLRVFFMLSFCPVPEDVYC